MTSQPPRSSASTRPRLTRSIVLDAALDLIDREGPEALSMRRLGKELGVEAMSLYNHVPNKAALLDGLVEQVLSQLDTPSSALPWPEQLREMARSYRKLASGHPHVVPLIAMRPFNTMTALEPLERALRILREAGFTDEASLHAVRTVTSFVTGYALAETGGFFGEHSPTDTTDVIKPEDLDPDRFPHLCAMLPTITTCDHDAEFEFGLEVMIKGLHPHLTAKRPGS